MVNDQIYTITTNDSAAGDGLHSVPEYEISGVQSVDTSPNNSKLVVGTNTTFTDDVEEGDWIVSVVALRAYRIKSVTNDTLLVIDEAPAVPFSGELFKFIKNPSLTAISITPNTGATVTVDGASVPAGFEAKWRTESGYKTTDPKVVNVTAGSAIVQTYR